MEFDATMVLPLRKKMGLTQPEFAKKINAGSRSVARWESGKMTKITAAIRNNLIKLHKRHVIGGKP